MAVPHIAPAASLPPADLHAAFTAAFADYLIGPFKLALPAWQSFLASQGADLDACRVALVDGGIVAFSLVAPRPELRSWRLATMGALPAARGSGAARALLDDFLDRARQAGMRTAELECFAQNERALRLYRGRGFESVAELFGYVREPQALQDGMPLVSAAETVALEDAYAWLAAASRERGDLPLQVTDVSLRARTTPLQALRIGRAQMVCTTTDAGVSISSLVDMDASQADAQKLVGSLLQHHAGQKIVVPQLQRHDVGGAALERLGFARQPLHQVLMRRPL
ncbi:GNAT family N-acetyltransferase [Caenimonas aquaedulcis]|uniref:GNAT family N-acetyltransferase n=1 Tax=Caenimonas aquaedulcis TaxID=2793270 RepID=A0A931H6E8_9BURK|nr:GNAT family N-acetyltransferase [Caenimonas aquaedulcis]MBG9389250.1 GNAT family N-acetyltransferase [Caenimonas aquaedulcis]